jgi:TonB family protein
MKKILFVVIALCFVFGCNFETFAQKRKTVKKPVRAKLVKCRVNGKIVYRKACPVPRLTNPEIAITPSTQGSRTNRTPDEPYGLTYGNSEGMGTGGGLGSGRGTGQGNGSGSGNGSGIGNGNTESETTVTPKTRVKPASRGVTQYVKIISKPSARYTDAARQNQVQGTVKLRVQFLANGRIGIISPINGLGYGLTEQAMAAARGIKFEPAMRNGKPYTVVRIIEYSFTIY